jgi:hypothetical protein
MLQVEQLDRQIAEHDKPLTNERDRVRDRTLPPGAEIDLPDHGRHKGPDTGLSL